MCATDHVVRNPNPGFSLSVLHTASDQELSKMICVLQATKNLGGQRYLLHVCTDLFTKLKLKPCPKAKLE